MCRMNKIGKMDCCDAFVAGIFLPRRPQGQSDADQQTAVRMISGDDRAAVYSNGAFGDRKSQPGATGVL
jgi:hypothetical protein